MKVIRIKLNPEEYYKDVLHILQAIPPFNELKKREIEVYAKLLYYNNKFIKEGIQEEERYKILFGYDMRRQIQLELNTNDGSFRNSLGNLRKLHVIEGRRLVDMYTIPFGEDLEFKFINT